MYRSIPGLADAFQSIADAHVSLNKVNKSKHWEPTAEFDAAINSDVEANQRLIDASQYYADMEDCTSRIAARLREIDSINLDVHYEDEDEDVPVSNQKRFIDDQCYRAQALLTGEYYLRNLHSQEVHKDMVELDERITFTAKNWKHSLMEMGISEAELEEPKPKEDSTVVAAEAPLIVVSDSKKVRRNSVIHQSGPVAVQAVEADYADYNSAELNELNDILSQFMDQAFLNGANGYQLSSKQTNFAVGLLYISPLSLMHTYQHYAIF